jgi:hypothetical protein
MNGLASDLISKHRANGILVDTNLLLLYIVGSIDIESIRNFKRTAKYNTDDFDIVCTLIEIFDKKIVTTPHILSQVSDLLGYNDALRGGLKLLIDRFVSREVFVESCVLVQNPEYSTFGIADAAIIDLAKRSCLVLTDDNPLFGYLRNVRSDVINLNEFREA